MVQVDHLSGENIGQVIGYLYNAGASNVQVIPTITKKNRPSHLIVIDCREKYADEIEEVIARELTTGGWHRINTEHRHLGTEIIKRTVEIKCDNKVFDFVVQGKLIKNEQSSIRPEHENCIALKDAVFQHVGVHISLTEAHNKISELLNCSDKNEIFIEGNNLLKATN